MRTAIIGSGGISRTHGMCLSQMPDVSIVGWADKVIERAQVRADEYGGDVYADYKAMLDAIKPDVAHICLPHFLHAPVAIECLKRGIHVLTEKPMCIHEQDAQAMIETARQFGKTLGVVFQNRYNDGSVLVKNAIQSGRLGKVLSVRAQVCWFRDEAYYLSTDWRGRWETEGGGVLINQSIHTLDLVRWLVDDAITQVQADYNNFTHPAIEVEDIFTALVEFSQGARANLYFTTNNATNAPVELHLHAENGYADIVGDAAVIQYADGTTEEAKPAPSTQVPGVPDYWGNSHMRQFRQFYDALAKGEQPEINGEEAIHTQRLLCALYESGRLRKAVTLG